jgi:hypothetical protein
MARSIDLMEGAMAFKLRVERIGCVGFAGLMMCLVAPHVGLCQVESTTTIDTLRTAKLSASVKGRIYREMSGAAGTSNGEARSYLEACPVRFLKLGPDGGIGVRVWGHDRLCGGTGNCSIWVFDPHTGDLLLSSDGFDFRVETTIHHGRYDILTRANMSAGTGVRDLYQFDGHAYQQVEETDETY